MFYPSSTVRTCIAYCFVQKKNDRNPRVTSSGPRWDDVGVTPSGYLRREFQHINAIWNYLPPHYPMRFVLQIVSHFFFFYTLLVRVCDINAKSFITWPNKNNFFFLNNVSTTDVCVRRGIETYRNIVVLPQGPAATTTTTTMPKTRYTKRTTHVCVSIALCCRWARRLEIIKQNNCRNRPINRSAHCLRPSIICEAVLCVCFKQSRAECGATVVWKKRQNDDIDRFTPFLRFALVSLQ